MATMSLDDWLKSQNAYYLDGGYEPDQAYKQLFAGAYDQYKRQADLDAFGGRKTYSGKAFNPILPDSVGWANVGVQGGGGIQYSTQNSSEDDRPYLRYFAPNGLMPFLSEQNGSLGYTTGQEYDDPQWNALLDSSGNPITKQSLGLDKTYGYDSYENAKNTFSSGYVPWNIDNVGEGLSNRQPFNLNALWGGTQYAQGRVTDWNHLDPTQYQSNYIAANTRNELWNEYDKLAAEGKRPAKNPDEVALDFYVKNVGQNGNQFGYGPGANTALITEAVKHQFLNSPDVIQARGTTYQTPQEKMTSIDEFGTAHQAGVPTWQVFEKQQYGSGFNIGSLIPMIIGGMALGPMAGAFGGGLAGNALAGALIGGTTAEIGGGDFLKGALTGGIGAGLTGGLSGISSEVASVLNVSQPVADAITKAAATAVRVGASGGDVEQAIIGSLVNSGVGGAVSSGLSDSGISPDIVKSITSIATPVISTAIQGGDVETALTNSLLKNGVSLATNLLSDPNSRDVEAQAGGYYGGAAPTTIAPPVVAGNDLSPLQYADTSNVGGTRIDVAGSPFYQGMEGSETIQAPEGMRLATYDEANQGGIEATTLPDGQMAFVVPDTQQEAPTVQQKETLPIDEAINQIVNNPPAEQPVVSEEQPDFTDQLAGVQQSFQTQFDQLSDAQKDQALALLSQGKTLEQAISSVETGLTEQFQTGINSLETNMNAYMQSGLTRDQAMQFAIDDLGNDVTQSNEDINRQLAELGLDTGTQFEEVGNQISNLGGTVTGLLGSVSNLGGTVSGLATNVATGQAQTQRQLEGINYQNTMEKLGKILAEPNQKYDSPLKSYLQPSFVNSGQAQPSQEKDYSQIIGELASVLGKRGYKVGGEVRHEYNPVEYVEGPEDRYYARHMKRGFAVNGPGTGQSDDIPTMLADGEYVIDADTVAALGDGSSKAGAQALDKFRENIRAHKRSAPTDKIPPKAKSPLEYLKMAQKPKGSKHG